MLRSCSENQAWCPNGRTRKVAAQERGFSGDDAALLLLLLLIPFNVTVGEAPRC